MYTVNVRQKGKAHWQIWDAATGKLVDEVGKTVVGMTHCAIKQLTLSECQYEVRVRAHNAFGWSPYSDSSDSPLPRPMRPAPPNIENVNGSDFRISWNVADVPQIGVEWILVRAREVGTLSWNQYDIAEGRFVSSTSTFLGVPATECTVLGLPPKTVLEACIEFKHAWGWSTPSSSSSSGRATQHEKDTRARKRPLSEVEGGGKMHPSALPCEVANTSMIAWLLPSH